MLPSQNHDVTYRLYQPSDHEAVLAVFNKQNIVPPVYLPLPGDDPAVAFVLVGERDGVIERAIILRATLEAHYVVDGEHASGPELMKMINIGEGVAMQINSALTDLNRMAEKAGFTFRYPIFSDVFSRVPRYMRQMISFMKDHLHCVQDRAEFVTLWKLLGR